MYSFLRAAVTKYYQLGGLKQQKLPSHSSRGQKSEIKVSAGPCSPWNFQGRICPCLLLTSDGRWQSLALLGLTGHHSNLCLHSHVVFSLLCPCFCVSSLFLSTQSYCIKSLPCSSRTSTNYIWKAYFQIRSQREVLGVRTLTYPLGDTQFNPWHSAWALLTF